MDGGRDRQFTRLEKLAQSLTIAIAAVSAGLALYRECQTLRRESSEFDPEALQVRLQIIESQLAEAQRTQRLDPGVREKVTKQLVDIRRRARTQLGKVETASSVDSNLKKAQNALESCGGPFSAPYPDAGISLAHHPADDFLPAYPSSSRYPQYPGNSYPLHAERRYNPPEGGRYSPTDNFHEAHYIPSRGGPPPFGHQYGSGGYSRGDQYGTRTYRTGHNNNPY